jgi:hypothetical protein
LAGSSPDQHRQQDKQATDGDGMMGTNGIDRQ